MFLWELPIGVFIILLVVAFFQWTQRRWDQQEREKEQKAGSLYFHMIQFSLEDQAYILNHCKPFYKRGYLKRLYYFACRKWDETENLYDDVERIIQRSRRSRQLRRKVWLRRLWRKVAPTKVVAAR